ncbi:hypothetical protein Q5752_003974 [Cryptotrichosporon argae]
MAERALSPDDATTARAPSPDSTATLSASLHAGTSANTSAARNSRPFSRSAAKRESVQLLGSIRDLQLRFSHTVLEHRAGAGLGAKPLPGLSEGDEDEDEHGERGSENRPPAGLGGASTSTSTPAPAPPVRRPYKDVELPRIGPDDARREARELVGRLGALWAADDGVDGPAALAAFVTTAQGVRRAKHLALAARPAARRVSAPLAAPRAPRSLSTPSRPSAPVPRAVSYAAPERRASASPAPVADDGGALRRAALDVLGQLRVLEERLRVHAPAPAIVLDDTCASPVDSTRASTDTDTDTTAPTSYRPSSALSGYSDADYDDDDYSVNALARADSEQVHQPWEERIVEESRGYRVCEGEDWRDAARGVRDALGRWSDVVVNLFEGAERTEAAWAVGDWRGRELERVHAFLSAYLPPDLAALLPTPTEADFRNSLLARLSDGYLAVLVHNAALHTSPRPWGFIAPDDMHDTLSAAAALGGTTGDGAREWTFRRTGNLTCWAAALKIRYSLPIALPPTAPAKPVLLGARPQPQPSAAPRDRARKEAGTVEFDPGVVARREAGWERALAEILDMWVRAAAREHGADDRRAPLAPARPREDGENTDEAAGRPGWV